MKLQPVIVAALVFSLTVVSVGCGDEACGAILPVCRERADL